MSLLKFWGRLLYGKKVLKSDTESVSWPQSLDPAGYCTVQGEGFDKAYSDWLNAKVLSLDTARSLGPQVFIANLGSRSGYVREFCLRALTVLDTADALKPVAERLNDYVHGNRELALHLTLRWLAELPLAAVFNALPELDALQARSRVSHSAVYEAIERRLATAAGREALVAGLMHKHAKVRRACWTRCIQTLGWSGRERIEAAMRCGDPAIARSVERDVFDLPDAELMEWFPGLTQVPTMPLRRGFLVALKRRELLDAQELIEVAIWDDSTSIRWLGRHWAKEMPERLLKDYVEAINQQASSRRQRYALEGLSQLKMREGVPSCIGALRDANPGIRRAALKAVCSIDTENQSTYVAEAMEDSDLHVVRGAFTQLVELGLPLPTNTIVAVAHARREEFAFFEMILNCSRRMSVWQGLHLATFTSAATPVLQLQLATEIAYFLNGLRVAEVYIAPTKSQWQAIRGWTPMSTLAPNSELAYVMDIYAKRMESC